MDSLIVYNTHYPSFSSGHRDRYSTGKQDRLYALGINEMKELRCSFTFILRKKDPRGQFSQPLQCL